MDQFEPSGDANTIEGVNLESTETNKALIATAERIHTVRMAAIGHAAWLMSKSGYHKHLFFVDSEWLLLPPILHGQYRMWRQKGLPVGFASWAFLSDEIDSRMVQGFRRLAPAEWKSGPHAWLIDLVAPFGGESAMVQDIKEKVLPGRVLKSLRPMKGAQTQAVEL